MDCLKPQQNETVNMDKTNGALITHENIGTVFFSLVIIEKVPKGSVSSREHFCYSEGLKVFHSFHLN